MGNCSCCGLEIEMSLSANFSSFKKLTSQAFTYLLDSPQQHPSLVAYSRYSLPFKYRYERPAFLELDEEATAASADHEIRPIMHPKRPLIMNSGYAEVINAGKTLLINEDQSNFHSFVVTVPVSKREESWTQSMCEIPCIYFSVFDGHAGYGAALTAYHSLHHHVCSKLVEISHMIVLSNEELITSHLATGLITSIDAEKLIIGALERAFAAMDEEIRMQRYEYRIEGGCTAIVSLFIKGKLYVASAGDSRAIIYENKSVLPMSEDHNPETERRRIQTLALHLPHLLSDEYTRLQFQHRCRKKDIGTKQLYRDYNMEGWSLKHIEKHDLRPQLVSGEGKRSRLLDTIGTTRGFGDHDLEVPYTSNVKIKPFLSSEPDVRVFTLEDKEFNEDDVLVIATDGLWEKIENNEAGEILRKTFDSQKPDESRRYIVAAQNLVDEARGILGDRGWRTSSNTAGSYDDISVFVIPFKNWSSCLDSVLISHHSKNAPKRAALEEDYLNIPHNILTQLGTEETKKVESLKTRCDEIDEIEIKGINSNTDDEELQKLCPDDK